MRVSFMNCQGTDVQIGWSTAGTNRLREFTTPSARGLPSVRCALRTARDRPLAALGVEIAAVRPGRDAAEAWEQREPRLQEPIYARALAEDQRRDLVGCRTQGVERSGHFRPVRI